MTGKDFTFILWSLSREEWWKPGGMGYTPDITKAGRFTQVQALGHVLEGSFSGRVESGVVMVAAPENWAFRSEREGVTDDGTESVADGSNL